MSTRVYHEYIVAAVGGLTALFIIVSSWTEFRAVASENPAVGTFVVGLVLLLMTLGIVSSGIRNRIWIRTLKRQEVIVTKADLSSPEK